MGELIDSEDYLPSKNSYTFTFAVCPRDGETFDEAALRTKGEAEMERGVVVAVWALDRQHGCLLAYPDPGEYHAMVSARIGNIEGKAGELFGRVVALNADLLDWQRSMRERAVGFAGGAGEGL